MEGYCRAAQAAQVAQWKQGSEAGLARWDSLNSTSSHAVYQEAQLSVAASRTPGPSPAGQAQAAPWPSTERRRQCLELASCMTWQRQLTCCDHAGKGRVPSVRSAAELGLRHSCPSGARGSSQRLRPPRAPLIRSAAPRPRCTPYPSSSFLPHHLGALQTLRAASTCLSPERLSTGAQLPDCGTGGLRACVCRPTNK